MTDQDDRLTFLDKRGRRGGRGGGGKYNASKHPRYPKGHKLAGQFMPTGGAPSLSAPRSVRSRKELTPAQKRRARVVERRKIAKERRLAAREKIRARKERIREKRAAQREKLAARKQRIRERRERVRARIQAKKERIAARKERAQARAQRQKERAQRREKKPVTRKTTERRKEIEKRRKEIAARRQERREQVQAKRAQRTKEREARKQERAQRQQQRKQEIAKKRAERRKAVEARRQERASKKAERQQKRSEKTTERAKRKEAVEKRRKEREERKAAVAKRREERAKARNEKRAAREKARAERRNAIEARRQERVQKKQERLQRKNQPAKRTKTRPTTTNTGHTGTQQNTIAKLKAQRELQLKNNAEERRRQKHADEVFARKGVTPQGWTHTNSNGNEALHASRQHARDYLTIEGRRSRNEDLIVLDRDTGERLPVTIAGRTSGSVGFTSTDAAFFMSGSTSRRYELHHNHPSSQPFSGADLKCHSTYNLGAVFAHGHDGTVYQVSHATRTAGERYDRLRRDAFGYQNTMSATGLSTRDNPLSSSNMTNDVRNFVINHAALTVLQKRGEISGYSVTPGKMSISNVALKENQKQIDAWVSFFEKSWR